MRTLNRIHRSWYDVDQVLRATQMGSREIRHQARWQRIREGNDQAYFLRLFAYFDFRVTDLSIKLRAGRSGTTVPGFTKRAWTTLKSLSDSNRELPFLSRLCLLIDKGCAEYQKVDRYYKVRNKLAHGDFAGVGPVVVPAAYADLRDALRLIKL